MSNKIPGDSAKMSAAVEAMRALTDEERLQMQRRYCMNCGTWPVKGWSGSQCQACGQKWPVTVVGVKQVPR